MSEENKNQESKTDQPIFDKADELIEKGKILADKAEEFISEKANQFKSTETFGKISNFLGSVGDFLDKKSDEFHSGEMEAKIGAFKEKAGGQANEILKKAKEAGIKIGDAVEEQIETFKGNKDKPGNQNGAGI